MVSSVAAHTPILSPYWYRLATLKPALGHDVRITRHSVRGSNWQILSRKDQRGQMRLNLAAWTVIARCDGRSTLDQVWQQIASQSPNDLPTQHDLIPLLARLVRQGFLICEDWPDLRQRERDWQEDDRKDRWQRLNPFAPRIRLGDPSSLIARCQPIGQTLFSKTGIAGLIALLLTAVFVLWQQWSTIVDSARLALASPGFWVISWCLYPVVKLIHELAHGIVLQHYGGRTPECGVALLMFMPAPYVDATDANLLASGSHRALVSAAGILTELALAALAIIGWTWLEPGLVRDALLAVAIIGSVSTVVFNANPLIRFDGYYVLTDLAGLPNLAERSGQHWRQLWQQRLLGLPVQSQPISAREQGWLTAYAPLAWAYRLAIMGWLAGWIGSYSRMAGAAILLLALITLFIVPVGRLAMAPEKSGVSLGLVIKARARLAISLLIVLAASFIPLPDRGIVQAVVWLPDGARVRATQPGYITAVRAESEQTHQQDQALITLTDPLLGAEIAAQKGLIEGLQNQWRQGLASQDHSMTSAHQELITQAQRRLEHLNENQQRLNVSSASTGRFRLADDAQDLLGRFVKAGDLLGFIDQAQPIQLRAALSEAQASAMRAKLLGGDSRNPLSIEVRLPSGTEPVISASVIALTPDVISELPSAALSSAAGGTIATVTGAETKLQPAQPTYQLDLQVGPTEPLALIPGQRLWVRLDFGTLSLLKQVLRYFGQSINTRMAPGWS